MLSSICCLDYGVSLQEKNSNYSIYNVLPRKDMHILEYLMMCACGIICSMFCNFDYLHNYYKSYMEKNSTERAMWPG